MLNTRSRIKVALIVLVPIGLWSALDWHNARKLAEEIERIKVAGEPYSFDVLQASARPPQEGVGAGGAVAALFCLELPKTAWEPLSKADARVARDALFDALLTAAPAATVLQSAEDLLARHRPLLEQAAAVALLPHETPEVMLWANYKDASALRKGMGTAHYAVSELLDLMRVETLLCIHKGDWNRGVETINARLKMAGHLRPLFPALLPALIAYKAIGECGTDTLLLLRRGGALGNTTDSLRETFRNSYDPEWMAVGLQYERLVRIGGRIGELLAGTTTNWRDPLSFRIELNRMIIGRPLATQDELTGLLWMREYIDMARQPYWEIKDKQTDMNARRNRFLWSAPVTALTTTDYIQILRSGAEAHAQMLLTDLALGARAFRETNGRYPASVDELCAAEGRAIPIDPLSGGRFAYLINGDAVKIYSTESAEATVTLGKFPATE